MNLLNNPHQIEGMRSDTTPYIIIFYDYLGTSPIGGGQKLIIGYEYSNGLYGAQFYIHYNGNMKKRGKDNGVWSDWTNV